MLNKNTCFTLRMFRIFINCLLKLVILLMDFSGCEGRQKGTTVRTSIIFLYSVWSGFRHILISSTLLMWIRSCVKETRFYSVKFYYESYYMYRKHSYFKKKYVKFDVSIPVPNFKTYFLYIWASKFPNLFLTALMNTL